uniref:Uncharacterized protein n=1 Tax=viral metagenome TaxID=1070528 RepID=A0A6C0F8Q7_9ZZZZ|tara:strand:+ start:18667 stop:19230 length:564 start_codon:yes stop_codon:yes gene_type:complete
MKIGIYVIGESFSNKWLLNWTNFITNSVKSNNYEIHLLNHTEMTFNKEFENFVAKTEKLLFLTNKIIPDFTKINKLIEHSNNDANNNSMICAKIIASDMNYIDATKNNQQISNEIVQFWINENPNSALLQVDTGHLKCSIIKSELLISFLNNYNANMTIKLDDFILKLAKVYIAVHEHCISETTVFL